MRIRVALSDPPGRSKGCSDTCEDHCGPEHRPLSVPVQRITYSIDARASALLVNASPIAVGEDGRTGSVEIGRRGMIDRIRLDR